MHFIKKLFISIYFYLKYFFDKSLKKLRLFMNDEMISITYFLIHKLLKNKNTYYTYMDIPIKKI